ncbi:toll-like receptor 2 type-2 [Ylistrum balloti]|uniref:toll-like receptor 2 type-2 n=1 Tax=Ylistrum balloti TaxID=509963 RepID=UPI002905961B|nr:toll-like receptor 2 type-2 [Ylistrum balloti]
MKYGDYMTILCFLWVIQQSGALLDCCYVTSTETENSVTCSGCHLRYVPKDLPINTTMLSLQNNFLTSLHQDSFPILPFLHTLNLQSNRLVGISSGAFDNVWNIENLDLSDNKINHFSISPKSIESLHKLKSLDIKSNYFHIKKMYPEDLLSTISHLEILSMDIFDGFAFGDGFLNLRCLQKLSLSFIGIESVSLLNASFQGLNQSNITELSIRAYIRKIEKNALSPFRGLSTLKLHESNYTMTIQDALQGLYGLRHTVMNSLTMVGFRRMFTKGVSLEKTDTLYLRSICVKRLYLTHNAILTISTEAVTTWSSKTCIEVLDLSYNRVYYPHILPLMVLFSSLTHVHFEYTQIVSVGKRSISTGLKKIIFLPKNLIYFNMTHSGISGSLINLTIADNNLKVLDISYSNGHPSCSYSIIKGLVNLKDLNMSGIDCSNPNPKMFSEFPKISRLTASQCNLGMFLATPATSLFKGLYNLSVIDVSSNNIVSINVDLFADQVESLKSLSLAGNHMDHIPLQMLENVTAIERIDLSNNFITTLSDTEYFFLEKLKSKSEDFTILLLGNPLVCSCDNLNFISWIESTKVIYKKEELTCFTTGGSQMKIGKFLKSFDQFQDSCVSKLWLIITLTLIMVFFLFGILTREVWKRSVRLRVFCRQPLEHITYANDIFISYCDEDSSWVAKTFIPWLEENEIEYCCEDKNFAPGRDKADNIMDAIDNSRQTVFVVSFTFLEREWSTFTLKLTSVYSFRDGRENMNIIILLSDIERSEFPKLVRKKWDMIRPLRWPITGNTINVEKDIAAKKLFWEKMLKRIRRGKYHFGLVSKAESNF